MNIDKTDFVNALAESGSEITIGVTPSRCFFVLLQSDKDLPDVHLKSGDAIAYVDPATSVTIGDSATYQGQDFTLTSKVKVKYIGDNPIYRLLGFQLASRLPPSLLIASAYSYEEISSENVSASFFLPSVYSYEEISSEDVSASFFLPSVYSYEDISSENVSASFFLPSVYSYEEISSENISASFFFPTSYSIVQFPTVSFDSVPLVNPQMQDKYYRVLTGAVTLLSAKQSVQSSTETALTVKFICSTFNHSDVTNLRAKIGTNATLVIDADSFSCYINAKAFVERQLRENNVTKYEYEVEFIEHTA